MGFDAYRTYRLEGDGALEGLTFRVRGLGTDQLLSIQGVTDTSRLMELAVEPFAASLIEWNVEKDGKPVPVSLDAVRSLEMWVLIPMIMKWMSAIADVDIPLNETSSSGGTSEVPPPGLASVSQSLAS